MIHNRDPRRAPVDLLSTLLVDRSKIDALDDTRYFALYPFRDQEASTDSTWFVPDTPTVRRILGMENA